MQLTHSLDDVATDLMCQGSARAHSIAATLTAVALVAVGLAWLYRDRIAAAGHQVAWSLVPILLGALHGLVVVGFIPQGCLARDDLSVLVGSLLPWLLASALARTGVAPLPPSLRDDPSPPPSTGGVS